MEASFFATDRASFQSFAALAFNCDVRPELPRVSVPTLLVQSSNDPIAPTAVGEYLHGAIAGSRLKVIDVPGHCPHITAPRALEAELRAFLEPP